MGLVELLQFVIITGIIIIALHATGITRIELPFFGIYQSSRPDSCSQFAKKQWVRLMDVFILGPVSFYIGYKVWTGMANDLDRYLGLLIIMYGVLTIAYNGSNYIHNQRN